jgi:hypothetical protein
LSIRRQPDGAQIFAVYFHTSSSLVLGSEVQCFRQ